MLACLLACFDVAEKKPPRVCLILQSYPALRFDFRIGTAPVHERSGTVDGAGLGGPDPAVEEGLDRSVEAKRRRDSGPEIGSKRPRHAPDGEGLIYAGIKQAVTGGAPVEPGHAPIKLELVKTSLCHHYLAGYCSRGSKCNFAHGEIELRSKDTGAALFSEPSRPGPELDLTCTRLREIVESEPGIPIKSLADKYLQLHGPIDTFGLPSFGALIRYAGMEQSYQQNKASDNPNSRQARIWIAGSFKGSVGREETSVGFETDEPAAATLVERFGIEPCPDFSAK